MTIPVQKMQHEIFVLSVTLTETDFLLTYNISHSLNIHKSMAHTQ